MSQPVLAFRNDRERRQIEVKARRPWFRIIATPGRVRDPMHDSRINAHGKNHAHNAGLGRGHPDGNRTVPGDGHGGLRSGELNQHAQAFRCYHLGSLNNDRTSMLRIAQYYHTATSQIGNRSIHGNLRPGRCCNTG